MRNVIPSTLWTMIEVLPILSCLSWRISSRERTLIPLPRRAYREFEIRRSRDGSLESRRESAKEHCRSLTYTRYCSLIFFLFFFLVLFFWFFFLMTTPFLLLYSVFMYVYVYITNLALSLLSLRRSYCQSGDPKRDRRTRSGSRR